MAFSGNHLFVGNYNGINTYDIDNPAKAKLRMSLMCPGGQGDVSVYGHLLFMSAEAVNGRTDCGTQGIPLPAGYVLPPVPPPAPAKPGVEAERPQRPPPPASPDRFRGVRIFDISDVGSPKQVAAVQSCRGSHTHTLVIDPKDKENVYIYISGTGAVRQAEELAGCSGGEPTDNPDTALFRIDIIKVPLAHPELAKIVASPRIFTDAQTGAINGLAKRGNHGEGTQTTSATDKCHDITVYSAVGLAAGACSGNGILLDISNPANPVRLDAVSDPNYAFWHSATFNNAGTKVLFTDEWGGGGQPRCRATDPMNWGADAIFTLSKNKLTALVVLQNAGAADGIRGTAWPTTDRWFRFPAVTSWFNPGTRAVSRWWISPMRRIPSRSPTSIVGPIDPTKRSERRPMVHVLVQRVHLRFRRSPAAWTCCG